MKGLHVQLWMLLLVSALSAPLCVAADAVKGQLVKVAAKNTISEEDIKSVQDKLQKTFTRLTVENFGPSPIPGIYQLTTNQRVIYYHPEKELLIMGAIFDKSGRNLTDEHISALQRDKIKELPLDKALVIGQGEKSIIEFTDPDCPYCMKLHELLETGLNKPVKRYVFFTPITQRHPDAPAKVVHILCSEDKEKAFHEVYTRQLAFSELKNCEQGQQLLAEHQKISSQFGVSGTPTIVLENSVLPGLDKARIAQFVNQQ